jgi:murein L,D-transpeptidase YcbB/YkuD
MNPELSRRLQRFGQRVDAAAEAEEARRAALPPAGAVADLDNVTVIRHRQHRFYRALAVAAAAVAAVVGGIIIGIGRSTPSTETAASPAETVAASQPAVVTEAKKSPTTIPRAVTPSTAGQPAATTTAATATTTAPPRTEPTRNAPPPACPSYTPTDNYHLDLCDSGPAVRLAQERLRAIDSSLTVDGYFGPATRDAVSTFQQQRGLTVDGQIGPETWRLLVPDAPGTDTNNNGVVDPSEILTNER